MFIVRVLGAAAKPALVGGALTAAAAGGFFAIDRARDHHGGTAFERVQGQQRLLISEFGDDADSIVAVNPDDVSDRTTIASIDHAKSYGIFPVLSPDGKAIAYTGLPSSTARPSPAAPAQAAIVDVNGEATLLADDIDLLVPPVWSPDSQGIVVRKNTPADDGPGEFDLVVLGRDRSRSTVTSWTTASVFPIAFAPDGAQLYFATLDSTGSDLYSVAPDGSAETRVAHLSDGIARDWRLSPDGAKLAYSVTATDGAPGAVTKTLDLASGAMTNATSGDASHAEYNPAWDGGGTLTIASVKPEGGGDAVSLDASGGKQALTDNGDSIDLPLAWSPDDARLAVRAVEGRSEFEAGASHLDLVARDGSRQRVSDSADVIVVGWIR